MGEYAIAHDPEMIFITGWNEWVAQRQPGNDKYPVVFVDYCLIIIIAGMWNLRRVFSEITIICRWLNISGNTKVQIMESMEGDDQTIDIEGDFSQWDKSSVTAKYLDYKNDTVDRKSNGFR